MTIKVRQRKPKDGQIQLFLDIYDPEAKKKRTNRTLNLYLYENPSTPAKKKTNKENLDAAEKIRSKWTLELAMSKNGLGDLNKNEKASIDFVGYFEEMTEAKYDSLNNYGNWKSALKHIKNFCPNGIPIMEIDAKWLTEFKYYLQHVAKKKSQQPLSQNSLHSYFNKVKACLHQAYRDEIILKNPVLNVKGFKEGEVQREFLTFEELNKAVNAECEVPQMKKAFIFSCLTGIRWSDIIGLYWSDLQYSEEGEYWLVRFRQKKTKGTETLPISNQAKELLGEIGNEKEHIFQGLKYSAWYNLKLQQWMMRAGISKTITFHCARHTFATLQLTFGTDIYTVSNLLGHRELKTTQIYARVIDEKKIKASNAIPNLNLK